MQKARRHNNNVAPTACKRMVSGSFHPPIRGTFHLSFTVLVHYRSLVSIQPYQMVLADSKGVSPAPPYSGITHVNRLYLYRALTFYGRSSQTFQVRWYSNRVSYNPDIAVTISVWANPSSLATTLGITFVFFSSGYLDVSVLRVGFLFRISYLQYDELSHSDMFGLTIMCISPNLFAAYHVLHRLQEPRHPPYALNYFS